MTGIVRSIQEPNSSPTTAAGSAIRAPTPIITPRSMSRFSASVSGPGVGGTSVCVIAPPAAMAMRHFR